MSDAQAVKVVHWVNEMVHFSLAELRLANWSEPSQPATFGDEVMERAYAACEPLSPSELGALIALAWGQNPDEHGNVLGRLIGDASADQFEHAVAALILLWHEKATKIDG